jgi:hypothetical protein
MKKLKRFTNNRQLAARPDQGGGKVSGSVQDPERQRPDKHHVASAESILGPSKNRPPSTPATAIHITRSW